MMDEFALIRLLNEAKSAGRTETSGVTVGIGDDAAVVQPSAGTELVVSCDTMVEDVHFKPITMRSFDIGYKAVASSLSDMAAMGARPRWVLIALTTPKTVPQHELERLYEGVYACANQYGTAVIGGDTTSGKALVVSVTVIGEVAAGKALLRSAAQPGDLVFVTGPLGASAGGLHALLMRKQAAGMTDEQHMEEPLLPLVQAHRRPQPQIEAGLLLNGSGLCRALNDVSDGIGSEAWEIAEASGVQIVLEERRIPLTGSLLTYAASVGNSPLEWALYGGEDYELIGTVASSHAEALARMFERAGLMFHIVGHVEEGEPGVQLIRISGHHVPIPKRGYNHFAE